MSRTLALAVLTVAVAAASSSAQNKADLDRLKADLKTKKAEFETGKAAADQYALRAFDQMIQRVITAKGAATDRLSVAEQLTRSKEQFLATGNWPENGDLIDQALKYARMLSQSYRPVSQAYEKLIDFYLKAGRAAEAQALTREKVQLDAGLPGRDKLTAGGRWHGSWARPKGGVVPIHVHVKRLTGTVFEAEVHENPGVPGHPIFDVRGVLDGLLITKCQTSRIQRGGPRLHSFRGFVVGDKILLEVMEVNPKGAASFSRVWLERR